jgi:iron complex outermembrane receptor protein
MNSKRINLASRGISFFALSVACAAPAFAQEQRTPPDQGATSAPGQTSESPGAVGGTDDQTPEQAEGRGPRQNEIVVTARRVEERLQDVPITVTALTSEDLERQGLNDLTDIAEATVGFNFEQLSGAIVQPSIRGQTNLRVDSPVQNVAFYIDGVYLQRGYLVDQSLLELQRVEVIKGPQSALYGRNAFAGAVNMVLRAPDLNRLFGKVTGTVGTDERYDIRGSISVPIIPDRLAVLVAASHSQFDGTWRNNYRVGDIGPNSEGAITKGNLGGFNKEAYQFGVRARPLDWLTVDGFYIRTERLIEASPTYIQSTIGLSSSINTLNCSSVSGQNRLYCGELSADVRLFPGETRAPGLVTDPRAFGLRGPTDLASAKVTAELSDAFELSYQYALSKAKIRGRGSVSRNPTTPFIFLGQNLGALFDSSGSGSSFKGESHQVRLSFNDRGPLRALMGVEYAQTKDVNSNAVEAAPIGNLNPPPDVFIPIGPGLKVPPNYFSPFNIVRRIGYLRRDEDIYSAFAFLEWAPSEQLTLSLEGRYTYEKQRAVDLLTPDPADPTIFNRNPPTFFRNNGYFTPRGSITYKFTPNNNVYASVARGVKSGGLNGATPFPGQRTYDDETNWTYEIGTKNSFFDNDLTLNLSAFHTDWQDLQTTVARLNAAGVVPPGQTPSTVGNLGGVKIWGAELELSYRVAEPLRIDLAAAYNRSRYTNDSFSQRFGASGNCNGTVCTAAPVAGQPTPVVRLGGNQLERVPEFEALGALTYQTEFNNGWQFFARGDVTYRTKQFVDEVNLAFVPDRTLVNASTGITIGNLDVQAWVRNLFDKKYVSNAFFLIGTNGALSASVNPVLGERRTAGITGTFRF